MISENEPEGNGIPEADRIKLAKLLEKVEAEHGIGIPGRLEFFRQAIFGSNRRAIRRRRTGHRDDEQRAAG